MVSVASLLNPDPPPAPIPEPRRPLGSPDRLTISSPTDEPVPTTEKTDIAQMTQDSQMASRSRSKGTINFPPFEDVDDSSLREIRRFQVQNFGSIRETCRRIPYNSGKKDFSQKTGRESFEVFQYEFRLPGEDTIYTVMWDYYIGLVRMTPFFKCCKYSKTTPAKMLGLNPGLRDITHSITGGSIKAQGYWMPYHCAKAVCATFCHDIAGALIPLFGPEFPSLCIPRDNPRFGHMVIDPQITEASAREALRFLHYNSPYGTPLTPRRTGSISPRQSQQSLHAIEHRVYDSEEDHRFQHRTGPLHAVHRAASNMDVDVYPSRQYIYQHAATTYRSAPDARLAVPRTADIPSSGWTAVNRHHSSHYQPTQAQEYSGANLPSNAIALQEAPSPYLSVVPTRRANRQHPYSRYQPPTSFSPPDARRGEAKSSGHESGRSPLPSSSATFRGEAEPSQGAILPSPAALFGVQDPRREAEKDAALMLMNLRAPTSSRATESPSGEDRSPTTQYLTERNQTPSTVSDEAPVFTSKPSSPSPIVPRIALPFSKAEYRSKRRATLT